MRRDWNSTSTGLRLYDLPLNSLSSLKLTPRVEHNIPPDPLKGIPGSRLFPLHAHIILPDACTCLRVPRYARWGKALVLPNHVVVLVGTPTSRLGLFPDPLESIIRIRRRWLQHRRPLNERVRTSRARRIGRSERVMHASGTRLTGSTPGVVAEPDLRADRVVVHWLNW